MFRTISQVKSAFRLRSFLSSYSQDADLEFKKYILCANPNLIPTYFRWFDKKHNLQFPAGIAIMCNFMCGLEEELFTDIKKNISYFVGAATRIADDLIDSGIVKPEEVFILQNGKGRRRITPDVNLFYTLNQGLESLLPSDFYVNFEESIYDFNSAQEASVILSDSDISRSDVANIKNRTGGCAAVLAYHLMFPYSQHRQNSLYYNPEGELPKTKEDAWFNFGAWLSRVDDLRDEKIDRLNQRKNLAIESLVTWRSLQDETEFIFRGFKHHYPNSEVDDFRKIMEPLTNRWFNFSF